MKKNIKKCFALILALCMMITAVPVWAASTSATASTISRGTTTLYLDDGNMTLNSNFKNPMTQWKSQNSNIVYIPKGINEGRTTRIYAKSAGTTHVYAITKKGNTQRIEDFTIVVKKKSAVKINCTNKTVKTGATFTVTLSNVDKPVTESIANVKIAKITSKASSINSNTRLSTRSVQVKALKQGTTTLTFTTGGKKYSCKIVVK